MLIAIEKMGVADGLMGDFSFSIFHFIRTSIEISYRAVFIILGIFLYK